MAKATFYIDEETLARFKRKVARRSGTMRRMSEELEHIVQDSLVEENLPAEFAELGFELGPLPSAADVRPIVPSTLTSSAEVIRKFRDARHGKSLSGH